MDREVYILAIYNIGLTITYLFDVERGVIVIKNISDSLSYIFELFGVSLLWG